ncbi:2'-5' RNA ligase family protein [Nocardioides bruguierae]|uniref:2'-5' RNA ligase family protein n=1 Tax=Nocardioides bruguierae TaxID=2945102 RepID=UPI0020227D32|nr:2'-5' RNA ligase family protein [Nocardioides bruguierae]MCL8026955.1 2'-5' RNA ligase family protein [Nocardioides bruguierae]
MSATPGAWTAASGRRGHTVLAVPVPALDDWVRRRTAHHDASFVSVDPDFCHAHVTVLAPWVAEPDEERMERVAGLVGAVSTFELVLERVGVFPDGLLHLVPEDDGPLRRLGRVLTAAFPETPPYGGRHADPVPHLTLEQAADGVDAEWVRASLGTLLPVRHTVDRVDLQWWANDDCRLLRTFPLAAVPSPASPRGTVDA